VGQGEKGRIVGATGKFLRLKWEKDMGLESGAAEKIEKKLT